MRADIKAASMLLLARKMALAPGSYQQNASAQRRRSSSPRTTLQRVGRHASGTLDGMSPRRTLRRKVRKKWLWISCH
jgi:hypothetical protein